MALVFFCRTIWSMLGNASSQKGQQQKTDSQVINTNNNMYASYIWSLLASLFTKSSFLGFLLDLLRVKILDYLPCGHI